MSTPPPPELTQDVLLTLLVSATALLLFVWGRLRIELVGLLAMASVIVLGLVSPSDGVERTPAWSRRARTGRRLIRDGSRFAVTARGS